MEQRESVGAELLAIAPADGRCGSLVLPAGSPCFVMYYTGLNNALPTASNCIGVAVSSRPDGGFVDQGILDNGTTTARGPVGCGDARGYSNIDPAPFVDVDGRAYLYFETGHNASGAAATISVIALAPDLIHAVGSRVELFSGTQAWEQRSTVKIVEGPWMHRRNSRYYLFYSGGDQGDYAMGYASGTAPLGPFVKSPANPILKGTASVLGPGGGSVVTGPTTGADQMIHHARAAPGAPRTLRLDRLVWNDAASPATVTVNGPTTTPQPLPQSRQPPSRVPHTAHDSAAPTSSEHPVAAAVPPPRSERCGAGDDLVGERSVGAVRERVVDRRAGRRNRGRPSGRSPSRALATASPASSSAARNRGSPHTSQRSTRWSSTASLAHTAQCRVVATPTRAGSSCESPAHASPSLVAVYGVGWP